MIFGKRRKIIICDNAWMNTLGGTPITPQCYDNPAEYKVIITYSNFEKEEVYLCNECLKSLRKYARKYGYKFSSKRL